MVALAIGARRVHALGRRVIAVTAMPEGSAVDITFTSIEGTDPAPVEALLRHVRSNGSFVSVAVTERVVAVDLRLVVYSDVTIRVSLWFERQDIAALPAMIASGVLDLSVVCVQDFALDDVADALQVVAARPSALEQVVLRCSD
ncbi:MAG: hypothetical protein GDA49_02160 [Rhodospirillales bacterium]|nr:hypothetical protein [Rhodospirillales bacterium]